MSGPIKLGLSLDSTGLSFRPALTEASRLGVAGLQLTSTGDFLPDRLSDTGRRELRHLLRSHDLELTALNCPLRHGLEVAENQQPRIEHIRKIMKLSFDLGPRLVIIPGPRVPTDPEAPEALRLREALRDLGTYADRVGVRLALEVGFEKGAALASYLDTFDTAGLAVNYDPANLLVHGHDPVESLTALLGRVAHVHARDARRSGVSRSAAEVPLGAGDIDWFLMVATLGTADYRGYLTIEREEGNQRLADLREGVAFLRRIL
jgi:sugar phosphate isomerase/epimerase